MKTIYRCVYIVMQSIDQIFIQGGHGHSHGGGGHSHSKVPYDEESSVPASPGVNDDDDDDKAIVGFDKNEDKVALKVSSTPLMELIYSILDLQQRFISTLISCI